MNENIKIGLNEGFNIKINPKTLFILSTSGSPSSIEDHNKLLQNIGLDLVYFTFPHNISSEVYAGLLKAPIIRGGAVTGKGLKSGIIPFLDDIDELGKLMNSVNTVINKNGYLYGYNTDAFGFETAIYNSLKNSKLDIKNAIIYGNGGVSAVAYNILNKMNIPTTMTGRNHERVSKKMNELGINQFDGPYDLIINATPVSNNNIDNAIGLKKILDTCKMVFDHNMPEKDGKKNFLHDYCNSNNKEFISGKEMYINQKIKQLTLFFDGLIKDNGEVWAIESDIIKLLNT